MIPRCLIVSFVALLVLGCDCAVNLRSETVITTKDDGNLSSVEQPGDRGHFIASVLESNREIQTQAPMPLFDTPPVKDLKHISTDADGVSRDNTRGMQPVQRRDERRGKPWRKMAANILSPRFQGRRTSGHVKGHPRDPDDYSADSDDECSESSSSEEGSLDVIFRTSPRARNSQRRFPGRGSWDRAGGGRSFHRGEDDSKRPSKRCRKIQRTTSSPTTAESLTPTAPLTTTAKLTTTVTITTPLATTRAVQTTQAMGLTRSMTEPPTASMTTENSESSEALDPTTATVEFTTTEAVHTLGIDPEPK